MIAYRKPKLPVPNIVVIDDIIDSRHDATAAQNNVPAPRNVISWQLLNPLQ